MDIFIEKTNSLTLFAGITTNLTQPKLSARSGGGRSVVRGAEARLGGWRDPASTPSLERGQAAEGVAGEVVLR